MEFFIQISLSPKGVIKVQIQLKSEAGIHGERDEVIKTVCDFKVFIIYFNFNLFTFNHKLSYKE